MDSPLREQPERPGWRFLPYEAARHADDHRRVITQTFACTAEDADRWLHQAGPDKVRILEDPEGYAGTALLMPMQQSFGGRFVPTRGVAGVAVPPSHRRDGVGSLLMAECLREIAAGPEPLSILYASTSRFYRGLGYELAGTHYAARWDPESIPPLRSPLAVRALSEDDLPEMQAISDRNALTQPGHMRRCAYLWPRLLRAQGEPNQILGVSSASGELRGFLAFRLSRPPELDGFQSMELTVCEAADAAGLRGLIALLRGHHSMVRHIDCHLPPQHPLWSWLPEQRAAMRMREQFLVRVVRVADALAARGFPAGRAGELVLRLHDPVLPDNDGTWQLRLADGQASLERTEAAPSLELDAGAFAPLYTGHQSAETLAQLGRARGSEHALRAASALFSGPAVTCPEMF